MPAYHAIISSDWNQCLAPCGPFDCIAFHHPALKPTLDAVFKQYTGNRICLADAVRRIQDLLPEPLSEKQMDAYLNTAFSVYKGVPELMKWCDSEGILFMINTTGMIGYFQRVFALGLLPSVPALSAHPMVRYPEGEKDPPCIYELAGDQPTRATHTATAMRHTGIPGDRVIVMGDSGGDGPHFAWAARAGAWRIGCMTKPSLTSYCQREKIDIDVHFGPVYTHDGKRGQRQEMAVDFRDLIREIETLLSS